MNRIGKSVSGLVIAGISILLVGGALITTLAQSGFAPAQNESPTNTVIQVPTQPAASTATFTMVAATSIPDSGAEEVTESPTKVVATEIIQTPVMISSTPTMGVSCTIPSTWIKYTVKSGDTLYSLANIFQTTYQELQVGNCMGSRTRIYTGDVLYVPNNATITPTPKPTKAPTDVPTKVPTNTPTATQIATPTATPTCYTITLSHIGNGTDPKAVPAKSTGCANGTYIEGEPISLTASPSTGYQVESWSGTDDDGITGTTNSLTMPAAAHTVNVTYSAICYTLTIVVEGTGDIPISDPTNSLNCSTGEYIVGEVITLEASNGTVNYWIGTDEENGDNINHVTMPPNNYNVTVIYQ